MERCHQSLLIKRVTAWKWLRMGINLGRIEWGRDVGGVCPSMKWSLPNNINKSYFIKPTYNSFCNSIK